MERSFVERIGDWAKAASSQANAILAIPIKDEEETLTLMRVLENRAMEMMGKPREAHLNNNFVNALRQIGQGDSPDNPVFFQPAGTQEERDNYRTIWGNVPWEQPPDKLPTIREALASGAEALEILAVECQDIIEYDRLRLEGIQRRDSLKQTDGVKGTFKRTSPSQDFSSPGKEEAASLPDFMKLLVDSLIKQVQQTPKDITGPDAVEGRIEDLNQGIQSAESKAKALALAKEELAILNRTLPPPGFSQTVVSF